MFPRQVASPLASGEYATFLRGVDVAPIVKTYRSRFNYDPTPDFAGLDQIAIYQCERTSYKFFYPYSIAGTERLYTAIEDLEWTYQEDQWEHEFALSYISNTDHVLDVGCGRGAFLARVKTKIGAQVTGIELNTSAAHFTRQRGITVAEVLLSNHIRDLSEAYDVVTAFQVLEHIAQPNAFVRDCVAALKPGGLLVLAVPNNDGFQQFDPTDVLNQPPHHMGLWNGTSLQALTELFPLSIRSIHTEPLRELAWYQQVMERRYLPKRWQRSLYYRLGGAHIFKRFIDENASSIAGHTIMAIYEKNNKRTLEEL